MLHISEEPKLTSTKAQSPGPGTDLTRVPAECSLAVRRCATPRCREVEIAFVSKRDIYTRYAITSIQGSECQLVAWLMRVLLSPSSWHKEHVQTRIQCSRPGVDVACTLAAEAGSMCARACVHLSQRTPCGQNCDCDTKVTGTLPYDTGSNNSEPTKPHLAVPCSECWQQDLARVLR